MNLFSFAISKPHMQIVFIVMLFVAASLIGIGYVKSQMHCAPPLIEYRYIPRSFREDQEEPVSPTDVYAGMFLKATPWVNARLLGPTTERKTDINQFFISQSYV